MNTIDIFPWDEHFNIGLSEVDKQHRKLVEILNRLASHIAYNSDEDYLNTIFDELTDYAIYHFETEEAVWNKYLPNDPLENEHTAVHKKFVDNITKLKKKQDTRPLIKLAEEVLDFLVRWLASHILESDRYMAHIVLALEDGLNIDAAKCQAEEKMNGSTRLLINIILSIYSSLSSKTLHLMSEHKKRQKTEQKIHHQNRYRDLLLELSTEFINLPLDKIDYNINKALEKMANFVGADRAYIFDYDYNLKTTTNTYEWCAKDIVPQIKNLQDVPMKFVPGWPQIHAKGEYVLIQDVSTLEEGPVREILFPQGVQSLVTFPLFENSECTGFVGFDAVKFKHDFSPSEIAILNLFSKLLSNIAERRHNESELSSERSFLKTLFQAIPDLVWIKNIDGVYLSCNSRFEDFFGAKESEILKKTDYDFVDKPLADLFRLNDNKVMQSGYAHINEEKVPFANDGHEEILQTTKVPMYDENGKLNGVMGVGRDITSIKEIQKELEVEKNRFALAVEGSQDGIWDWDIETNELFFGERFEIMLGYIPGTLENNANTWFDLLHPDDKELASKIVYEYLNAKGKGLYECTFRLRAQDGSWRWILGRGKAQFDKNGKALRLVGFNTDITEKKLLEQELEQSYKMLHKLTENIPGAIYQYRLYPDGSSSFPYASKNIENVYEVSPEDIVRDASLVFKNIYPDDLNIVVSSIKESAETMKEWDLEYRVDLPTRGLRWLHGKSKPEKLNDGSILWHGVINDITEQVISKEKLLLQTEQLQQKKLELETIIQDAPNPMILHEEGGKIIMLNQAWINSSGYSLEDIPTIDDWVEQVYDTESRNAVKEHINSLYELTEKSDEGEFTFFNKNREQTIWQFSSAPLGIIDGKHTIISSAMDITELKHKDEMLINQSRHAAMGEMIGMIAHQWRQPISAISMDANNMLLDIAMDNLDMTASEEYANSISKQTQHLSETIDDFRNFFKPDKEISKVNIRDILDKTLSIVKDSLKNHNIEFKSSFETETEVNAYQRELMQVFVNIITNSKDALISTKRENSIINIRVYEDRKYVNTEICDNAGGIDAAILPKVFDPYFSTKDEKNGTGLGLYMSKMIIEEHLHGEIEVSNKNEGACFKVSLLKEL